MAASAERERPGPTRSFKSQMWGLGGVAGGVGGSLAPEAIKFTHASQFNYASVMSLEIPQSKTYGVGRRREDCLL